MAEYTIDKFSYGGNIYNLQDSVTDIPPEMVVLSYGISTWADFEAAYSTNSVVYCRASSNADPSTGDQKRLAFMAYVNSATPASITEVEFQYYRSVATHTISQQGDQVFVYKLNKSTGWSVTTREASTKIAVGATMTGSYSNGTFTLNAINELPTVTAGDNGKTLGVTNGAWNVVEAPGVYTYSAASCTIPTAGWTDNSITITVTGVTATNDIILAPAASSINNYIAAGIFCTAQNTGTLTFTRKLENDSAIIMNIMILNDNASSSDASNASGVSF